MYRSDLKSRDKGSAVAAVVAIHAALLFAFLHLSGKINLADPQSALRVFDITEVPPPPPSQPEPPRATSETQKPKEQEGAASAKNMKSQATPVVAPKPPIELPIPLPVNASQTPNQGAAPTQGASNVSGPGTGAGGTGTGTGSGSAGNGTGGGGQGLAAIRTRLATRPLRGRDFPPQMLDAGRAARGSGCGSGSMRTVRSSNVLSIRAPASRGSIPTFVPLPGSASTISRRSIEMVNGLRIGPAMGRSLLASRKRIYDD